MTRSSDDADLQMDDVSKAYRNAMHDMLREEPSHAIDDAIRAAARRGVSAGPVTLNKSWFSRARFPLAAAATVLLTGSLIFIGMREDKNAITTLNQSSSSAVTTSLAKADAGVPDAKPVVPPETYAERKDRREMKGMKETKETKEANAKPVPPKEARRETVETSALQPKESKQATATNEPARTRTDAPAQPFARTLQAPVTAAPPPPPAAAAAATPPTEVAVTAALPKALAAPAPAASDSVAQAPGAAAEKAEDAMKRRVVGVNAAKSPEAPTVAMAPTMQAAESGAAARSTVVESADRWIGRMVVLQSDGKTEQLHAELKRFRKTYPSATLPAPLQDEWVKIQE
jgi:hypothetical protein